MSVVDCGVGVDWGAPPCGYCLEASMTDPAALDGEQGVMCVHAVTRTDDITNSASATSESVES